MASSESFLKVPSYAPVRAAEIDDGDLPNQGVAVPVNAKQGHSCCGGCCDMRRAVVFVNLINIFFTILVVFLLTLTESFSQHADEIYDDDAVKDVMHKFNEMPIGLLIGVMVIKIVMNVVGVVGAVNFNIYMVAVSAAVYLFMAAIALIALNPFVFVYAGCFAYPHFVFIHEVCKGVMSEVNYPTEKQSCCCV